ncbi:hypothetical protein GN958_ATG16825, partial [Phytophthora infestans]
VTINGMPFDTVKDPHFFLTRVYGPRYMTLRPRRSSMSMNVSMNVSAKTKAMLKLFGHEVWRRNAKKLLKRSSTVRYVQLAYSSTSEGSQGDPANYIGTNRIGGFWTCCGDVCPPVYSRKYLLSEDSVCSPRTLSAGSIKYHSGHRFYSVLREMDPPPSPTFRGEHTSLCQDKRRFSMKYSYCLPISGRKDTPFCIAGDRTDLLNARSPKSICYTSVLHMLMVDVYEELKATGNTPMITLEDFDKKARLYDPNKSLTRNFAVPYVDLYKMKKMNDSLWDIQEFVGSNGRFLSGDKVEPFSQVTINGMQFDT